MEITDVKVKKFNKENSRMKGIASVVLDASFKVNDIRIIEGDNGLFVAMPSKKVMFDKGDGQYEEGYKDIAHPVNQETRDAFQEAILAAYENAE